MVSAHLAICTQPSLDRCICSVAYGPAALTLASIRAAGKAMPPPLLSSPTMAQHLAAHLTVLEIARPMSQQELLAVCSLHRLHSLKMCCASLPGAGACQIPAQISCLQALQSLQIDSGIRGGGSDHTSQLPPDISRLTRLTSMQLYNCIPCMRSVAEMSSLRGLSLHGRGGQPQVPVLVACDTPMLAIRKAAMPTLT